VSLKPARLIDRVARPRPVAKIIVGFGTIIHHALYKSERSYETYLRIQDDQDDLQEERTNPYDNGTERTLQSLAAAMLGY
jgi:hypothetical protein